MKKIITPLVSIIIPSGPNRLIDLKRCLTSIANSDYPRIEVIVVNNSPSFEFSKTIHQLFPKVTILEMTRNLAILGMNIGMAYAKGKYVLIIDDDCTLNKNSLSRAINIFKKLPPKVMVLSALVFNPLIKTYNEINIKNGSTNRLTFADGASLFKKELFEKVGYYYDQFFCWVHGDDLSVRIICQGYQIAYDPSFIINHYDKVSQHLRANLCYYFSRNSAWMNILHFHPILYPILIARNIATIIFISTRQKSLIAFLTCLYGYLCGWITFWQPLRSRKCPPLKTQIEFLRYYISHQANRH